MVRIKGDKKIHSKIWASFESPAKYLNKVSVKLRETVLRNQGPPGESARVQESAQSGQWPKASRGSMSLGPSAHGILSQVGRSRDETVLKKGWWEIHVEVEGLRQLLPRGSWLPSCLFFLWLPLRWSLCGPLIEKHGPYKWIKECIFFRYGGWWAEQMGPLKHSVW